MSVMIYGLVLSTVAIFLYFYYYYKKIHYKFRSAGIKYLPGVPIFGNVLKSTLLRRHFIYDLEEVYNAFPEERYVGFADGMRPVILVRDPELMKIITVKDFDHFQNRKEFFPVRLDPLIGRNVLQLKDLEWKYTRAQLTPAFTSARLRHMLPIMVKVCKNVLRSLESISIPIDLTEPMYRYSGDSVVAGAFGLDLDNAGEENSIFTNYSINFTLNFWRRVLIFVSIQFPNIGQAINKITWIRLFKKENYDFLREAIFGALEYRRKNNLVIPDYMDVLLKSSEGKSLDDLAGQFFFSYMASMESSSGTLRLCLHELALNPDIQERLYQEIRNHNESKEMTMESIGELKYLDCVLQETSRKWSVALMMDRICSKSYVLPPPREGGKPYTLKRGDMVFNVVNPVHMDHKYHANPEVIDPERFSADNRRNMQQFTFLPFGMGPRGCLGIRFATLQLKVMIYHMLLRFKLLKCDKTTSPIQLQPDEMNMKAVGGTWVLLEPRK